MRGKARALAAHPDRSAEILAQYARDTMARYSADLEMMCEIALQGGKHGVLVRWAGPRYSIEVHRAVPYGQIWEQR